jgi:hypothetical protein
MNDKTIMKYQRICSIICVVLSFILIVCGWFYERKGENHDNTINNNDGNIHGNNDGTTNDNDEIFK